MADRLCQVTGFATNRRVNATRWPHCLRYVGYWPRLPLPLRRSPPKFNTPIPIARPHSPPQTAPGSDQPFRHNSHVRTDRQTGGRIMFNNISAMLVILIESDALITITGDPALGEAS